MTDRCHCARAGLPFRVLRKVYGINDAVENLRRDQKSTTSESRNEGLAQKCVV